jgi:hypothetical protein
MLLFSLEYDVHAFVHAAWDDVFDFFVEEVLVVPSYPVDAFADFFTVWLSHRNFSARFD